MAVPVRLSLDVPDATDWTAPVVGAVLDERARNLDRWGIQSHPDGTGPMFAAERDYFRELCDSHAVVGSVSWRDIFREEVYEALSETDPAALERELVQVGAVVVAWLEDLRRREVAAANEARAVRP